MYLRNKGNISLNKTRKLKRRRQNGGARGARRATIRSLMKRIATSISPQSVSLFSRKRSKASSKVSPDVPIQQRNSVSVSRKANSAEPTTVEEDIRKAAALSAEVERLIKKHAIDAALTEQIVDKTMDRARTINNIISGTQSKVDKSDAALLAELEEELSKENSSELSSEKEEEEELRELVKSLSAQEQRELGIPTSKGGRRTRKQKKSRTRRGQKK
jgi:hypothetical protein